MPTWPIPSIKELLEPTLNHMGYELYSLDQSGQSGRTLRISIDHNKPITVEDCERVSRVAGPLLDRANLIDGRYELEVSSPAPSARCATRTITRASTGIASTFAIEAGNQRQWSKVSSSPSTARASPSRRPAQEAARR